MQNFFFKKYLFENPILRVGAGGRISSPRSICTRKSEAVRTPGGQTAHHRHLLFRAITGVFDQLDEPTKVLNSWYFKKLI